MLNKYELKEELLKLNTELVDKIIKDDKPVEFIAGNYNDIKDLLISRGFERLDNFDTNGWEIDFWDYFDFNEKHYMLSGSLYYGNMMLSID